ncbi:hypothetical protein J3A83DRAFT_4372322 [Scleroderma citrinum]
MDPQQLPDCTQSGFAALIDLIMAQDQFTRDEALVALNQHWHEGIAGGNHPEEGSEARANKPGGDSEAALRDPEGQGLPLQGENRVGIAHPPPPQQHLQAHPAPPECMPSQVDDLDPTDEPHLVTENPFNYNPKAQVASILHNHPADYTLKCLENFKFIHMWYFTRDGL